MAGTEDKGKGKNYRIIVEVSCEGNARTVESRRRSTSDREKIRESVVLSE